MKKMKRIIISLFIALVLLMSIVSAGEGIVIFEDIFDRVDSSSVGNGWSETESTSTAIRIVSGTVYMSRSSTPNSVLTRTYTDFDIDDTTKINYRVKVSSGTYDYYHWVEDDGNYGLYCKFSGGNYQCYDGSSWNNVFSYTTNTYYNITFEYLNVSHFNVRVDGTLYDNGGNGFEVRDKTTTQIDTTTFSMTSLIVTGKRLTFKYSKVIL